MRGKPDLYVVCWMNLKTSVSGQKPEVMGKDAAIKELARCNRKFPILAHWLEIYNPKFHKVDKTEQ